MFVTGGIGGVHRNGHNTLDISADLGELSSTPVAVVCAGAKSLLDIPRTLEVLESLGVPVIGYGTDVFPAFFTRNSGVKAPISLDSPDSVADLLLARDDLALSTGAVIGVPIPEADEAVGEVVEAAIGTALDEADQKGIEGKDLTPFLLARIAELTGGASLTSNIALVHNNAKVGGEIALALANLHKQRSLASAPPLVVGGAALDTTARPKAETSLVSDSSAPGLVATSPGGVGLNVATGLAKLGAGPLFVSRIGNDSAGSVVLNHADAVGVLTSLVQIDDSAPTASYIALMDEQSRLLYGVADMGILDNIVFDPSSLPLPPSPLPPLIVVDGNLSPSLLSSVGAYAAAHSIPLYFEPTSVAKAAKLGASGSTFLNAVTVLTPNQAELSALASSLPSSSSCPPPTSSSGADDPVAALFAACPSLDLILIKDGPRGVTVATPTGSTTYPPPQLLPPSAIVSVTGAGDTFLACFAWAYHIEHFSLSKSVTLGQLGSSATLQSPASIAPSLSPSSLLSSLSSSL